LHVIYSLFLGRTLSRPGYSDRLIYILIYISSTPPPLAVLFNLQDVEIPVELDGLFSGLPEETFRVDLSSTDLRKQMAARIQNKT